MGACHECRAAKVKCDRSQPACGRCRRLGKPCTPHESKQGQRPHKRRRSDNIIIFTRQEEEEVAQKTEETAISNHVLSHTAAKKKNHYGIRFLLRQWVSLAFTRRSLSLLTKAGTMALQCGLSMDDLFCSQGQEKPGLDFLSPLLTIPTAEQKAIGSPLTVDEIPARMWRCSSSSQGLLTDDDTTLSLQERWIFVRETKKGVSRFYCSPGFERHVVTRALIEETYQANQIPISDLYLDSSSSSSSSNAIRGFSHQLSQHTHPGMLPKPTLQTRVKLKTKSDNNNNATTIVEVDQIWSLFIPDLEHSFGFTEFIPSQHNSNNNSHSKEEKDDNQENELPPSYELDWNDDLSFLDLNDIGNGDDETMEFILNLLLENSQ